MTTNMESVVLCKDDVPGSSLEGRKASELKNDKLQFWLKCCSDDGKGLHTKVQLVKWFILILD